MTMSLAPRRVKGLDHHQIEYCEAAWEVLEGSKYFSLDTSTAHQHSSRTRFVEDRNIVVLGADAYPGTGIDARARMSVLACLAHELSHAIRYARGYSRPLGLPDVLLDEAETSLNASFILELGRTDRVDLVEDAADRIRDWLVTARKAEAD